MSSMRQRSRRPVGTSRFGVASSAAASSDVSVLGSLRVVIEGASRRHRSFGSKPRVGSSRGCFLRRMRPLPTAARRVRVEGSLYVAEPVGVIDEGEREVWGADWFDFGPGREEAALACSALGSQADGDVGALRLEDGATAEAVVRAHAQAAAGVVEARSAAEAGSHRRVVPDLNEWAAPLVTD